MTMAEKRKPGRKLKPRSTRTIPVIPGIVIQRTVIPKIVIPKIVIRKIVNTRLTLKTRNAPKHPGAQAVNKC